jgi:hypothetical protein
MNMQICYRHGYKCLHKKLKTEETKFHLKSDVDASALGGLAVPAPTVVSIVVLINDTSVSSNFSYLRFAKNSR